MLRVRIAMWPPMLWVQAVVGASSLPVCVSNQSARVRRAAVQDRVNWEGKVCVQVSTRALFMHAIGCEGSLVRGWVWLHRCV